MGDKIVKSKNLCCQPVVFPSPKIYNERMDRDSCTYYIIFQNFVISSFRHIFSVDMPTTFDWEKQQVGNTDFLT